MKKIDVISYFGSVGNVAKALGISHASVSGWGEVIPSIRNPSANRNEAES